MLFDLCQIHIYASPHSLYHQYSLLSSGVEGFDEHANESELKALLSLHLCVNIHRDLALLRKETYSTRCCSDNSQVDLFSLHGATSPNRSRAPNYRGFKIIFRHTTFGDQPQAPPFASQHTTLTRDKTFISPIPAREWPQTHALDRADIGIGQVV